MPDQPRARGTRSFLSAAVALVACSALVPFPKSHAREADRVAALKAGYLFNFMKFVEWPPLAAADTITVCFLGDSAVYDELSAGLPDKRLGKRRIVARRLAPAEPMVACQVLYIDAEQLPAISAVVLERPTGLLTVSDAPEFLQSGGIIGLFDEDHRLRFRISVENARRANLRISSSLLQLASAVVREG
jgi:uncharacterized protein DUF4154